MKIVIDIDDKLYDRIKYLEPKADTMLDRLMRAIQNGTPLPKGHWIEIAKYSDGKHKIECSECGNHIFDRGHANSFNVKNKSKFCPNCGAKMTYVPDTNVGEMGVIE